MGFFKVFERLFIKYFGLKKYEPIHLYSETKGEVMDKQIRKVEKKIKKDTKGEEKSLKGLEKADKKRDKLVDAGKKAMKGKC